MYRVSIELYKHEWKFGRTRNTTAFSSSPKLSQVFVFKQLDYELEISIAW